MFKIKINRNTFNKFKYSLRYNYDDPEPLQIFMGTFKRIPKYSRAYNNISINFLEHLKKHGDFITFISLRQDHDRLDFGNYIFHYKGGIINFELDPESRSQSDVGVLRTAFDKEELHKEFCSFHSKEDSKKDLVYFGVVLQKNSGLYIKKIPIELPNFDLELNYGKDFVGKNSSIILSMKNTHHGLYLFHGSPGTGKTTYIKYLASLFKNDHNEDSDIDFDLLSIMGRSDKPKSKGKLFVYLPAALMNSIADPSFASLLLEQNVDIVLVLEDAEDYVKDRGAGGNGASVATLLNLTDGIMGSILNVSVIVTFNFAVDKIDGALRRKGRLFAEHSFNNLSIDETQKLLDHLEINHKAETSMSLAEIYNFKQENFAETEKEKNNIGFGF